MYLLHQPNESNMKYTDTVTSITNVHDHTWKHELKTEAGELDAVEQGKMIWSKIFWVTPESPKRWKSSNGQWNDVTDLKYIKQHVHLWRVTSACNGASEVMKPSVTAIWHTYIWTNHRDRFLVKCPFHNNEIPRVTFRWTNKAQLWYSTIIWRKQYWWVIACQTILPATN